MFSKLLKDSKFYFNLTRTQVPVNVTMYLVAGLALSGFKRISLFLLMANMVHEGFRAFKMIRLFQNLKKLHGDLNDEGNNDEDFYGLDVYAEEDEYSDAESGDPDSDTGIESFYDESNTSSVSDEEESLVESSDESGAETANETLEE